MKIITTVTILLALVFQTYSQNVAIELPEYNLLYRGYDNVVKLCVNNTKKGEIILSGTNVEIFKKDDTHYRVVAGSERTAELVVLRKHRSKTDTLYKIMYRVSDMPDPTIYLGGSESGTQAGKHEKHLFAKYPGHIPLNARHTIRNWELIYGDKTVSGFGSDLSRAKDLIDALPAGATVTIKCEVIMPSKSTKSIYGVWQIE